MDNKSKSLTKSILGEAFWFIHVLMDIHSLLLGIQPQKQVIVEMLF